MMNNQLRTLHRWLRALTAFALLAWLAPPDALAQISAGSEGLSIRPTEWFSSEGLAFQLAAGHPVPVVQNRLSRSATAVTVGPGASLPQVYRFAEPVSFSGTVRIRYRQADAVGHDDENLWVFTQSAADQPFRPVASLRDIDERFVQATLDNQQVQALTLADPTQVGYALAPETPDVSAINQQGFTLEWPQVAGATAYRIEVATSPDFTPLVPGMDPLNVSIQTTVALDGLEAGTTYHFRLVAVDAAGDTKVSPAGSAQTERWKLARIDPFAPLTVSYATPLPDVPLPAMATVYLENGDKQSWAVTWDGGAPVYNGTTPADYSFAGTVVPIDGAYNPDHIKASITVTVERGVRTLDFPAIGEKVYGDDDFDAGATASSGEAVTYTSDNPSVAEVTDNGRIRITGAGSSTITATAPANANYTDRPSASRVLTVRKAGQAIVFHAPAQVNRDAGSIALDISSSSGLPVTLNLDDEQVATLDGTTLTILRLGTVHITATQAGDNNHEAAEPVTVTIRVVDPTSDFPLRVHPAVSPNEDGINEFLMIEGIRDYGENRVSIFNRNGTVLWEASGYDNDRVAFRGISTGQLLLPAGTYFYIVEVKDGSTWKYRKGYFVLRY